MTMHDTFHPDDDRLAAYSSADREAVDDRELAAHISGCERCRPFVEELTLLRDALALLPDLAPSRPLRLIPPAPEPAAPRGARGWLRRLAAPAMAAGAGLVLVGAVGTSGLLNQLGLDVGGRTSQEASASVKDLGPVAGAGDNSALPSRPTDSEGSFRSDEPRSQGQAGSEQSVAPAPTGRDEVAPLLTYSTEQPWLTLLIAGFGLLGISALLRFSLAPRAG
ncbi:MAG: hypothetical protein M3P32_05045 [Chloroflexota bacterium]|nr:hypothetical protein [Chloroflexota bacterium]